MLQDNSNDRLAVTHRATNDVVYPIEEAVLQKLLVGLKLPNVKAFRVMVEGKHLDLQQRRFAKLFLVC